MSRPNKVSIDYLKEQAKKLRIHTCELVSQRGRGYVQQGLGASDIFSALFFSEMNIDPKFPDWENRDRLIVSTAHNSAVYHAALHERGFFDKETLDTYCQDGSKLEINITERLGKPVEATCGSLGQGLSVAVGICLSAIRNNKPFNTYVVLGDGELQEGQVWEAAIYASNMKISNLCMIIDFNELQVEGKSENAIEHFNLFERWNSHNWNTIEIDGNNLNEIIDAFETFRKEDQRPTVIIAKTLPGKGVSFLEGIYSHQMFFSRKASQYAVEELMNGK